MENTRSILITGGSGSIGTRLTELLFKKGYQVAHLGRSVKSSKVKTFLWNPDRNQIDRKAIEGVDVVVHLAGAGIADKRWTERRKYDILRSRTQSARLLIELLNAESNQVKTFISASGINYYGLAEPTRGAFEESDPPGDDFMARVCVAWENEVNRIANPDVRRVILRTGPVLTKEGGALEKLVMPVRYYVGAPLGSGNQCFNWIHIDDLCRIYVKVIEDESMSGAYNAVSPHPVSNKELTRAIARALNKPLWLPPVPSFAVRLLAGEVSEVVLKGGKISSARIEDTGFEFRYDEITGALSDLL
jgi:hypothetical protein